MSYVRLGQPSPYLECLVEQSVKNWGSIKTALEQRFKEDGLKKLNAFCTEIVQKRIDKFKRDNPALLLPVNKEFTDVEKSDIRNCLLAVQLLLNASALRLNRVELKMKEGNLRKEKVLAATPSIVFHCDALPAMLGQQDDQEEVLILRFLSLSDEVIQSEAFAAALKRFKNLRAIDLSGNPNIKWEGVMALNAKFSSVKIYSRFCFYDRMANVPELLIWYPLLSQSEVFRGKKIGVVVAESEYIGENRTIPSAGLDGNAMAEVLERVGFNSIEVKSLKSLSEWEAIKSHILSLLPQEDTPVALFFAFFGHGAQSNGVPFFETADGKAVSVSDVYGLIASRRFHRDSTFCFVFGCCQGEGTSPANQPFPAPGGSVMLRMARNGEVGWSPGHATISHFVASIKRAFSRTAPLFEVVSSAAAIHRSITELYCEVSHTVIPLALRWW